MRVGIGFDVHKLDEGESLVLGGVAIAHRSGLEGHSDADVLVHALVDAILGAAALGDIGSHFPPRDPEFKDTSSLALLAKVRDLVGGHGWRVINLDATIVAEQPRLAPHISEMRGCISHTLGLQQDQVNIKATTTDGVGFAGREEGIAAHAIAAIERIERV